MNRHELIASVSHSMILIWSGEEDAKLRSEIEWAERYGRPIYLLRIGRNDHPPSLWRRDLVRHTVDIAGQHDIGRAAKELHEAIVADVEAPDRN